MAQIRLQPPDPFNFRNPDDWSRWRQRFQQFREASGLSAEAATKQISTFLYCLGEEAESVLASTNATDADRRDFDCIIAKFDAYFQVRKNVIYERARFNRRNQQSGETAEQYIMALYALAKNCDYGGMTDEMIRDRLVIGIRDSALSEKLQMDATLTLEHPSRLGQRGRRLAYPAILCGSTREPVGIVSLLTVLFGTSPVVGCLLADVRLLLTHAIRPNLVD